MTFNRKLGLALIVYAVAFNIPYIWLASNFGYPGILRRPSGEILTAFTAGGSSLILAWFAFMVAAVLLAPVAVGMSKAYQAAPGVAGLGIASALSQAIGLSRWVYAVPGIAAAWVAADPASRGAIEASFSAIHQLAGVGIGETIGQTLTAFWLVGMGYAQARRGGFARLLGWLAWLTALILVLGQVEGLATAIPFDPGIFGLGALVGFLLLALWLILSGIDLLRGNSAA
jgi:hypothetical protein